MLEVGLDRLPVVVMNLSGRLTLDDCELHNATLEDLMANGRRFGLVLSAPGLPMPALDVVQGLGKWFRAHSLPLTRFNVCTALYVPSPVVRGAFSFAVRCSSSPSRQESFPSCDDAVNWVVDRLREHGVSVPDAA